MMKRRPSLQDALIEENTLLRAQVQKLRIDFENSESVQYDFVKLSQQLQVRVEKTDGTRQTSLCRSQMQLEEFRNSENELRWQPEEDFNECQRCRNPFSVTVRRHRCRHCGQSDRKTNTKDESTSSFFQEKFYAKSVLVKLFIQVQITDLLVSVMFVTPYQSKLLSLISQPVLRKIKQKFSRRSQPWALSLSLFLFQ